MSNNFNKTPSFPDDLLSLEKLDINNEVDFELVSQKVTLQVVEHIFNSISERDNYTDEFLPVLLSNLLEKLDIELNNKDTVSLPNDYLFHLLDFTLKSFEKIFISPKQKILKEHEMMPIHKVKNMSPKSMNWIGKLPGRSIKEKLSGKPKILAQRSKFSVNTKENRVFIRVLKDLSKFINARLNYGIKSGLYDFDEENNEIYKKMNRFYKLSTTKLRKSELNEIKPAIQPETNNVLINDRNYSVIWKGWQKLSKYKSNLEMSWKNSHDRFIQTVYWSIISKFYKHNGFSIQDNLSIISDKDGSIGVKQFDKSIFQFNDSNTFIAYIDNSKIFLEGRIKLIINNEDKKFGFIVNKDKSKYYFSPKTINDAELFESLKNNQKIYFKIKETKNKKEADKIVLNIDSLINIYRVIFHQENNDIIIKICKLEPENSIFNEEKCKIIKYTLNFINYLRNSRGISFSLSKGINDKISEKYKFSNYADSKGLRSLSSAISQELFSELEIGNAVNSSIVDKTINYRKNIGFDFSSFISSFSSKSSKRIQLVKDLYTISFGLQKSLILKQAKKNHIYSFTNKYQHLNNLISVTDKNNESFESYHKIISNLSKEIIMEHDNYFSYTVPDIIDEFSQKKIKSVFQVHFKKSIPVWRSIAGALSLQNNANFNLSQKNILLVLDTHSSFLSSTILKTKRNKKLNDLIFEHYPPLPYDESDKELSFKSLQVEYIKKYLNKIKVSFEEININGLINSGIIEKVLINRKEYILTLDNENYFKISYDKKFWETVIKNWYNKLKIYLKKFSTDEIYKQSVKETKNTRITIVILSDFIKSKREIEPLFSALSKNITCHIISNKMVSSGASTVSSRLKSKLPTWEEYLPDLSLEVVKNGHFDELKLVKRTSIEQSIGMVKTFPIKEALTIPANQKTIKFPLISGLTNGNPIDFEAVIEDESFPLSQDTGVKLEVKYRYGFENSYELLLTPIDKENAPFKHIIAKWVDEKDDKKEIENIYPEFPDFLINENSVNDDINILNDLFLRLERIFINKIIPLEFNDDDIKYLSNQLKFNKNRLRRILLHFDYENVTIFMKSFFKTNLLKYLANIIGIIDSVLPIEFFEICDNNSIQKLKRDSRLFLSSMGVYTPKSITEFLLRNTPNIEILNRLYYLRDDDRNLIDKVDLDSVALNIWFNKNLIKHIYEIYPNKISVFIFRIEKEYKKLLSSVMKNRNAREDWKYTNSFRDISELLLAILRLREFKNDYEIEVGSKRMKGIAKYVRTIDSIFYRISQEKDKVHKEIPYSIDSLKVKIRDLRQKKQDYGIENKLLEELQIDWKIKSRVQFNANKPESLKNMSDLAYVLNAYLTGDTGKSRIQITGVDDIE